jgi:RNase P subunit RPR2
MNPTVTDIKIEPRKLEELKALLKTNLWKTGIDNIMRKYGASLCNNCEEVATVLVTIDVSDSEQKAKRLERFCRACYEKNKVQLLDTGQRNNTVPVREKNSQKGA